MDPKNAVRFPLPVWRIVATHSGSAALVWAGAARLPEVIVMEDGGIGVDDAVAAVSILRLATAGITLAVGGAFLLVELRRARKVALPPEAHFDRIAGDYLDQFSPHIWDLLLQRTTALLCSALPAPGDERIGIDPDPDRWRRIEGLRLERVEHFTFLPDFLPRALLQVVLPLERRLERSRLRAYSVHCMAVLRKPGSDGRTASAVIGATTADASA